MIRKLFYSEKFFLYILFGMSIIFFAAYQYLHEPAVVADFFSKTPRSLIANQPDEMSVYFFTKEAVLHSVFGPREALSEVALNQVHPRSMTVIYNHLAPIGSPFIIVLFFFVARVFVLLGGENMFNLAVSFIVPAFAAMTPLLVYGIVNRIWKNREYAFVTSLLLFILPPWWYYSSYVFQHTIPYLFFVILGLYGVARLYEGVKKQIKLVTLLTGLSFAIAVAIRPFEVVWIGAVILFSWYFLHKKKILVPVGYGIVGGILGVAFLLFANWGFYGHPLGTGYIVPSADGGAGIITHGTAAVSFLQVFIAPFGFHPIQIVKTAYRYIITLFIPWFILILGSLVLLYRNRKTERQLLLYTAVWFFISLYLLLYYGSWNSVTDTFTGVASIGSGHVRYFMPIYVGAAPLIGYTLLYIIRLLRTKFSASFSYIVSGFLFLLFASWSLYAVYYSGPTGLYYTKQTLAQYYEEQQKIAALVPSESVVVTRFSDKSIFPIRKVIIRNDDGVWADAVQALLIQRIHIYWYDMVLSPEEDTQISTILEQKGLEFGDASPLFTAMQLREIRLKSH